MIHIDGSLAPVPAETSEEAYRRFAENAAPISRDHVAARVVARGNDAQGVTQ